MELFKNCNFTTFHDILNFFKFSLLKKFEDFKNFQVCHEFQSQEKSQLLLALITKTLQLKLQILNTKNLPQSSSSTENNTSSALSWHDRASPTGMTQLHLPDNHYYYLRTQNFNLPYTAQV